MCVHLEHYEDTTFQTYTIVRNIIHHKLCCIKHKLIFPRALVLNSSYILVLNRN